MPRENAREVSRGNARPRVPPLAGAGDFLPVLDMGLDFRSYQHLLDENGLPVLGNVINFPVEKVADIFEPTVGLLVSVLHLYFQSATTESARSWIGTYDIIQKLFTETIENKCEPRKYSEDARKAISASLSSGGSLPDQKLGEKLLIFLDHQSGIRGLQAPSQRRIPRDPKGTFCNLHLSDHRCNQEFSCNQLHLHQAGVVKHRTDFHVKLIETLLKNGLSQEEVLHRTKDSLLYARYGNKVTVRFGNTWVPFFKTSFTKGRLEQALRLSSASCPGRSCQEGENCKGIHVQDERNLQGAKQVDLPLPGGEAASDLESEAMQLFALQEQRALQEHPRLTSPTTEQWRNTVRDYVRQAGIQEVQADEALLKSLQGVRASTPMNASGSDTFTPLLHEVEMKRFDSNLSMDDSK